MKKTIVVLCSLMCAQVTLAADIAGGRLEMESNAIQHYMVEDNTANGTWWALNQGTVDTATRYCDNALKANGPHDLSTEIRAYVPYNPMVLTADAVQQFQHDLIRQSYPVTTPITKLKFSFCVSRNGPVSGAAVNYGLELRAIYRNNRLGVYYANLPAIYTVAWRNPLLGDYADTVPTFVTQTWDLAAAGASISSDDLANITVGFEVKANPLVTPVNLSALKIYGMIIEPVITGTLINANPPAPTITYVSGGGVWGNGVVTLHETMPNPSTGEGLKAWVRCDAGFYAPIGGNQDYLFGTHSASIDSTHTINAKNTFTNTVLKAACTAIGRNLGVGSTPNIQVQQIDWTSGSLTGNTATSNSVTLN